MQIFLKYKIANDNTKVFLSISYFFFLYVKKFKKNEQRIYFIRILLLLLKECIQIK